MNSTPTTVHQPDDEPDGQPGQDRYRRRGRQREVGGGDAGERVDRAHRKVDPPRHQDQSARRGDDQRGGLLVQDVEQVDLGEERPAGHRQHHEQDQEREDDGGPAQPPGQVSRRPDAGGAGRPPVLP
jgi:hypothetical protein